MSQLVLTPVTRYHIAALAQRAHAVPLDYHHIRRLCLRRGPWPEELQRLRVIEIPYGFRVHLDTAHYKPGWLCRHLAVTGPDKWPNRESVDKLMALIGFRHSLEACCTWYDGDSRRTVHVLEPLDGDWSPLRSS